MNSCDIRFPAAFNAAAEQPRIRWELFAHRDVRAVLPTLRTDTLRVLHRGPADHAAWSATLAAAGFPLEAVQPGESAPEALRGA